MINSSSIKGDRRTRIIATLGPASGDLETVTKLIKTGVNVVRLNMSHGNHEHHKASFNMVRKAARSLDVQVAIFCDLCGPKIRVGVLQEGQMELKARSEVIVTTRKVIGREGTIPCQYASLHKDVKAEDRILIDDGKMELKVLSIKQRDIKCKVVYGGILKDKKGINLPDSTVSSSSLTENDKKDVRFAQQMGADFIALSFVRSAEDIQQLKQYMRRKGVELPVISKIEKPEALHNFDEILEESYAIMVARGDLGIEIDGAQVPIVQKELINRSRQACRPVIVATQMMESMITDSRPTRAEVGDISNAALNGADAVMLSGETSVGKYPIQAVRYMQHILLELERWQQQNPEPQHVLNMMIEASPRRALTKAAVGMALDLKLLGLFVPTTSGETAGVVSAFRPSVPIVGICTGKETARRLMLHWGIKPVVLTRKETRNWEDMMEMVSSLLKIKMKGQQVAILSGFGKETEEDYPVLKLLSY